MGRRIFVRIRKGLSLSLFITAAYALCGAAEAPKLVEKDGRWALIVESESVV